MTAIKEDGVDNQAVVEESVPDPYTAFATHITDTAKLLKVFAGEPAMQSLSVLCFARTAMPLAAEVLALDASDSARIVAEIMAALESGGASHDPGP